MFELRTLDLESLFLRDGLIEQGQGSAGVAAMLRPWVREVKGLGADRAPDDSALVILRRTALLKESL